MRIDVLVSRKSILGLLGGLVVLAMHPLNACAEAYPSGPIHIVVPFPAGGTVDPFARLAADRLSKRLGQPVIVDNIAGATGAVGTSKVARAKPDGYTLLFAFSSHVVTPALFSNLPYDPINDFEPITLAVATTHVLTVTPSFPASTVSELLSLIRANPGKYTFASGGVGTQAHLLGEKLRLSQHLDITHVPYNGAVAAVASVMSGQTPIGLSSLAPAAPQLAAGTLRAIAVTSELRTRLLPQVPTMAEAGYPEIVGDLWIGVLAPAKTPKEITNLLHDELVAILMEPDTKERLETIGFEPVGSTPAVFQERMKAEMESYRKIALAAKVKAQ